MASKRKHRPHDPDAGTAPRTTKRRRVGDLDGPRPIGKEQAVHHSSRPRKQLRIRAVSNVTPNPPHPATTCTIPNDARPIPPPALTAAYPSVATLRTYLLSRLPRSSRRRRRAINAIPLFHRISDSEGQTPPAASQAAVYAHDEGAPARTGSARATPSDVAIEHRRGVELARLLDTTLVGHDARRPVASNAAASQAFLTQLTHATPPVPSNRLRDRRAAQHDLVDFAVERLFARLFVRDRHPPHALCHGYARSFAPLGPADEQDVRRRGIPGLDCVFPNAYVAAMKGLLWQRVLGLVALEGDVGVMLDLLLDCGVFLPLPGPGGNYYQLSGRLLSDLPRLNPGKPLATGAGNPVTTSSDKKVPPLPSNDDLPRTPTAIVFVRSRILHGRAALTKHDATRFGLPHLHVLNKYKQVRDRTETKHVLQYLFPRQHRLHNVFTSRVDRRATAQPFHDYTLREDEIRRAAAAQPTPAPVPRRLRGPCLALVQQLRVAHRRCSYTELLKHYCPVAPLDQRSPRTQRRRRAGDEPPLSTLLLESVQQTADQQLVDFATPVAHVSAYCRAVLAHLLPHGFLGGGTTGAQNRRVLLQRVDAFVRCSRFEKMTLHGVAEGIKVAAIAWLAPPRVAAGRLAPSDWAKRTELLLELLYYVFDSLLIPLLRATFHVTESTQHGNRLFFFRHDVWRALTEPALRDLKAATFAELPPQQSQQHLQRKALGVGTMRLVPKGAGVRMIANLRRRAPIARAPGRVELGPSINAQLEPVHCMLKFERARQADFLAGACFSMADIYPRLKAFQTQLRQRHPARLPRLYFAKADVQACFDTLPQGLVVRLLRAHCADATYARIKHAELRRADGSGPRFVAAARALRDFADFGARAAHHAAGKRRTVFVETIAGQPLARDRLLRLLTEHVQDHVIKIGKRHYRQKTGIPQGSVLSTLLCSFAYADFARTRLPQFDAGETLLLRLIDDFLLVTTNKQHAVDFVTAMHAGAPEYGIRVRPAKTLVNFACTVAGTPLPSVAPTAPFPYCGTEFDPQTLGVRRDRARRLASAVRDALTVDQGLCPGRALTRKVLHAFRLQTTAMFTDTRLNGRAAVRVAIFQNAVEAAMKMHRYLKAVGRAIDAAVVIGTIRRVVRLAIAGAQRNGQTQAVRAGVAADGPSGFACEVAAAHHEWLVASAFRQVLGSKPTGYARVLAWLDGRLAHLDSRRPADHRQLRAIAARTQDVYAGYRY